MFCVYRFSVNNKAGQKWNNYDLEMDRLSTRMLSNKQISQIQNIKIILVLSSPVNMAADSRVFYAKTKSSFSIVQQIWTIAAHTAAKLWVHSSCRNQNTKTSGSHRYIVFLFIVGKSYKKLPTKNTNNLSVCYCIWSFVCFHSFFTQLGFCCY